MGASIPTYNYTRYDYLGRVVETAEFMQNEPMNNAVTKDPAALEAWLEPANTSGKAKHQVVVDVLNHLSKFKIDKVTFTDLVDQDSQNN